LCGAFSGGAIGTSKVWGDSVPIYPANYGGRLGPGATLYVAFRVPAALPPASGLPGYIQVAEFQGPPAFRQITVSRFACDFRAVDPSGNNGPMVMVNNGLTPGLTFNVGRSPTTPITLGGTYYFNVRNYYPPIGDTCATSNCPVLVQFTWPR
jgi:hypothetical protein